MEYISKNLNQTKKIASRIALQLKKGDVLALFGDLGSGKTTFTGFLVEALGVKARVQSPTFVLHRKYQGKDIVINHLDLYRITSASELSDLGLPELFEQKDSITIIEWPELAVNLLPKDTVKIGFEYLNKTSRKIYVQNLY